MKEEADRRPVFEQLRCPKCSRRLGDVSAREYTVALYCRRCHKIVTFKKVSVSH